MTERERERSDGPSIARLPEDLVVEEEEVVVVGSR